MSLMSKSGLPCYGRGHPLENLKKRFHLEMSDSQAAAFMRSTVQDAYDKVLFLASLEKVVSCPPAYRPSQCLGARSVVQ